MLRQSSFLLVATVMHLIFTSKANVIHPEVIDEIEQSFIPVSNIQQLRPIRNADATSQGSGIGPITEQVSIDRSELSDSEELDSTPDPIETTETTVATAQQDAVTPEALLVAATTSLVTEAPTIHTEPLPTTTIATVVVTIEESTAVTTAEVATYAEPQRELTGELSNGTSGEENKAAQQEVVPGKQLPDHLAFYLGIAAAGLVGSWLVLGPCVCLILHARRKWRQHRYQDEQRVNSSGSWVSRWHRNAPNNRAATPPRSPSAAVDEAAIPLHPRRPEDCEIPPTITITQPYTSPTMTTFSSSDETKALVSKDKEPDESTRKPRSTIRTDI